jgi:hypothetical protein
MVSDFSCKACGIEFSVGPFHYHSFEKGYSGKCLFVCRSCGGQYAIEIALSASAEEYNSVCEIVVNDYTDKGKKFLLLEVRKHNQMSIAEALVHVNNTPFTLKREQTENGARQAVNRLHNSGVFAESRVYEQRKNPFYGFGKRDRFLGKEHSISNDWVEIVLQNNCYDGQRLVVESLNCKKCVKDNVLTSKWDETDPNCPSCSEPKLILSGRWLT